MKILGMAGVAAFWLATGQAVKTASRLGDSASKREGRPAPARPRWCAGVPERVGSADAWRQPPDEPLAHEARSLSAPDRAVRVATFWIERQDLEAQLADGPRRISFAHDLLFAANPDTRDPRRWAISARTWDDRRQTMRVETPSLRRARDDFQGIVAAAARRSTIDVGHAQQATRRLLDLALGDGRTWRVFWAHWDNRDDTAFDGLILIDGRSGEVRVVMTHNFA
jgi:hypothetical protein